MPSEPPIGTIPLSALTGRKSASMERSLKKQVLRDLALSPLERMEKALRMGAELKALAAGSRSFEPPATG